MRGFVVTVFGSAGPAPGSAEYIQAYDLGRSIARQGWTLCNGGYGGTMEAGAEGATAAGGHTIGVTCRMFTDRPGANRFIREEMPTPDLFTRLKTLIDLGNAFVVLPGGTGTLLELALIWELTAKRLLPASRPIVLLGPHWTPVLECVAAAQPDLDRPQVVGDVHRVIEAIGREALGPGARGPAREWP